MKRSIYESQNYTVVKYLDKFVNKLTRLSMMNSVQVTLYNNNNTLFLFDPSCDFVLSCIIHNAFRQLIYLFGRCRTSYKNHKISEISKKRGINLSTSWQICQLLTILSTCWQFCQLVDKSVHFVDKSVHFVDKSVHFVDKFVNKLTNMSIFSILRHIFLQKIFLKTCLKIEKNWHVCQLVDKFIPRFFEISESWQICQLVDNFDYLLTILTTCWQFW